MFSHDSCQPLHVIWNEHHPVHVKFELPMTTFPSLLTKKSHSKTIPFHPRDDVMFQHVQLRGKMVWIVLPDFGNIFFDATVCLLNFLITNWLGMRNSFMQFAKILIQFTISSAYMLCCSLDGFIGCKFFCFVINRGHEFTIYFSNTWHSGFL